MTLFKHRNRQVYTVEHRPVWVAECQTTEQARLLAAAPELLEIAQEYAASCTTYSGTLKWDTNIVRYEKALAAIAKATGG